MATLRTTLPREPEHETESSAAGALTLRLVYTRDQRAGGELVAVRDPMVIGREHSPGGWALDDGWMSRHHAKVARVGDDQVLVVEDLGSRNGTWVDAQRISGRTALAPGQLLRVGATVFVCGLRARAQASPPAPARFVVDSPLMEALWQRLVIVAQSDEPALVVGEIGSGKTAVARLLHDLSQRASGPFVPHNSSAIPPNLEEATLFGVAAGFIPGVNARSGLLAQADGGTLFLDELADLPAPAQAKLLDAFDPNAPSFLPVGAPKRVPTRCRLVVAVQRDVFELVGSGRIRHDLASRLAIARLDVPPLRERREDLMKLFEQALARFAPSLAFEDVVREPEIAEALLLARWTENVRGLESLARRVALGEVLSVPLIRAHADRGMTPTAVAMPVPAPATLVSVWPPEPGELLDRLAAHDFEVTLAAEHYGRTRETVGRHLTKTFGPGGKDVVKRAYRVWRASGRAPDASEVGRAYALYFGADAHTQSDEARARWSREGALD